jgi:hypothetical protein
MTPRLPLVSFALACLLAGAAPVWSQAGDSASVLLTESDLPGWTLTNTAQYSDKELYGYIDGGAELYREYGFCRLTIQIMSNAARELSAEVYRMRSPEAAFGIFSLSRGSCEPDSAFARWSCFSGRQILCCRGVFVLSVVGNDSSLEAKTAMAKAARTLLAKIGSSDYNLPALFASPVLRPRAFETKFLSNQLALQQARPEWEPYFEGIERFALHALSWESGEQWYSAGMIRFSSAADSTRFLRNTGFGERGIGAEWRQISTGSTLRGIRTTPSGEMIYCETDGGNTGFRPVLESINP